MSEEPIDLLHRFVREGSETAFRALVHLHSSLVYGTALRFLNGDRAAAQDVMQEVFTLLARKAPSLHGVQLSGWLYRQSCRRAADHVRAESRRRVREKVAVDAMNTFTSTDTDSSPLSGEIDEAMISLPSPDRDALVLRFFEDRDFRAVGRSLGITEEAARKRVTRAMEKLVAMLKRRGIPIGASTLGSTMTGLGRNTVPEALVSKVSATAIQSLPATAGSPVLNLLKPFACGVLLTSLIAAATLFARRGAPPSGQAASTSPGMNFASPNSADRDKADSSSLDLISRIKRIKAGPEHSITALRLSVLLASIKFDEIPAFIARANTRLTTAEQTACYLPLLKRWHASDPHAAIEFALKLDTDLKPPGFDSTDMLRYLLHDWKIRDMPAMQAWLLAHLDHPSMKKPVFGGPLGHHLAVDVSDELLREESVAESFAFVRGIADPQVVRKCLEGMTGGNSLASAHMNIGPERLLELYREFSRWPDPVLSIQLKTLLWQNLNRNQPERAEEVLRSMTPREVFETSLSRIGKYSKLASKTEIPGGSRHQYETVDNTAQGEADAMAAGLAAGLPRDEILQQIGAAILLKPYNEDALPWIDRNLGGFDADPLILAKIGSLIKEGARPDASAAGSGIIQWAMRLGDPQQRAALARAGFMRLLAESRKEAEDYMAKPGLPGDLKADFQNLLTLAPR